ASSAAAMPQASMPVRARARQSRSAVRSSRRFLIVIDRGFPVGRGGVRVKAQASSLDGALCRCHSVRMENIQSKESQGRVADAPSGHWVYRLLPRGLWPYAQLARWDRPIGWWLLMWPCWWSTAMASAAYAKPGVALADVLPSVWHLFLFMAGSILMRGAGCTYNDIVDQDIDEKVARTRSRPLPAGKVSQKQAWGYLFLQCPLGLVVRLQIDRFPGLGGNPSLLAVGNFPGPQRFSGWAQLFPGQAFSWGALL